MPGRGPGGLGRRPGIGNRQIVRQVEQSHSQAHAVAGLAGQPDAFAEVGGRLRAPLSEAEVEPAALEQAAELAVADADGLAEGQRLGRQPVRVRRPGGYLH